MSHWLLVHVYCDLLGLVHRKGASHQENNSTVYWSGADPYLFFTDVSHETCSLGLWFPRLPKASSQLWRCEKQKKSFYFNPTNLVPENVKVLWTSGKFAMWSYKWHPEGSCPHHVSTRKSYEPCSVLTYYLGDKVAVAWCGSSFSFWKGKKFHLCLPLLVLLRSWKDFELHFFFFFEISLCYCLKSSTPLLMPYSQTWRKESNYQLTRLGALGEQFFSSERERRRHTESTGIGVNINYIWQGSICFLMILILGV